MSTTKKKKKENILDKTCSRSSLIITENNINNYNDNTITTIDEFQYISTQYTSINDI